LSLNLSGSIFLLFISCFQDYQFEGVNFLSIFLVISNLAEFPKHYDYYFAHKMMEKMLVSRKRILKQISIQAIKCCRFVEKKYLNTFSNELFLQ